jgi:hypothetical protein
MTTAMRVSVYLRTASWFVKINRYFPEKDSPLSPFGAAPFAVIAESSRTLEEPLAFIVVRSDIEPVTLVCSADPGCKHHV